MTGKKLKELRDNRGLTQVELALMIGASTRTISSWETGDRPINDISETALLSILLTRDQFLTFIKTRVLDKEYSNLGGKMRIIDLTDVFFKENVARGIPTVMSDEELKQIITRNLSLRTNFI